MGRILRILLALTLVTTMSAPMSAQRKPLLTKVEHFYLISDNSERLFQFFRDELQLPVVWPYKRYGDFASGGLSLGNIVMEFVTEKATDGTTARTEFKGIAFEPTGDADTAVAELERMRIPHGKPDPYKYTQDGQERVGWVTIELKGVPPANAYVFICDYKQREQVAEGRSRASSELAGRGGGPLGVISLREIALGVKSVKEATRKWAKLGNSPVGGATSVFSFGRGPKIRLVQAEVVGIQSIVIGVKSALRAKQFLTKRQMIGKKEQGQLCINATALDGLKVMLVED